MYMKCFYILYEIQKQSSNLIDYQYQLRISNFSLQLQFSFQMKSKNQSTSGGM